MTSKKHFCLYTPPFSWINSYYQMVDLTVELGLSAVEGFSVFEFETPDLNAARKIRNYADKKGIVFSCLSVYADFSRSNFEDEVQRMKRYAEVAAILGSPYLHHTIIPDFQSPERIIGNEETFFQRGIRAVREVYDYAYRLGVSAIYEGQGYVFNGVRNFSRFLKEIDRDVGVVMDLGNTFQVDEKPEDFIAQFHNSIVHVHIKDASYTTQSMKDEGWLQTLKGNFFNPCRPGEGAIEFNKCISMLRDFGYNGYYGFEFDANPAGIDELARYVDNVQSWVDKG